MRRFVFAVDPGYEKSAYVLGVAGGGGLHQIINRGIVENHVLVSMLASNMEPTSIAPDDPKDWEDTVVVLEQIESYGMAVGREVFETVFWTGRFYEAAIGGWSIVERLPRANVKLHLCHSKRAKDANVRMALIDRWGGKTKAIGTRKAPGPLYGVTSHQWAALAIAVTWAEQHSTEQRGQDGSTVVFDR